MRTFFRLAQLVALTVLDYSCEMESTGVEFYSNIPNVVVIFFLVSARVQYKQYFAVVGEF
jgi:hypothetical protein